MAKVYHDKFANIKPKRKEFKSENNETKTQFFLNKFVEFCKRTDFHGFKYIVMEELNIVERSCWVVAIIMSIFCAVYFVITAYRWYARNPIVTVIESTQGAIWDVPFPAVTICDLNVISRKAALNFAHNISLPVNVSADFVFKTLRWVPLLHSSNVMEAQRKKDLQIFQGILDLNNISIENLFSLLSPASSCSKLVERCMWKSTMYRCDQLFQRIFTSFGACCAFNYYAVKDVDDSHKLEQMLMPTPRRVASCGYHTALTVLLRTDFDDYYSTTIASYGFTVFVDNAYNIPDLDSPVRLVNPSTEILIALSPESTYATSGIKSFRPEQRQCYFSNEVTLLKHQVKIGDFVQYSFHNCIAYQKIEIIRKICNCVPFYFPLKYTGFSQVCNFKDMDCLENAMKPIEDMELREKTTTGLFKCLPACEHYDYPLEVALGKLASNLPLNGLEFFNNVNMANSSVVNVFFNDLTSTRYRRDSYLNWQNILAAFGGLLSLMLGFTLVSGCDFILFITFRVIYGYVTRVFGRSVQKKEANKTSIVYVEEKRKKPLKSINEFDKWDNNKSFSRVKY